MTDKPISRRGGGPRGTVQRPAPVRVPAVTRAVDPYANLGVYERVAFFVNPTAGSPVGGAKEIMAGAKNAGVTLACLNVGDGGNWIGWRGSVVSSAWTRCDTGPRCALLQEWGPNRAYSDIANIESPEMNAGFCTPKHAMDLVGPHGAIITEGLAPHSPEWPLVGSMPVFLEIDPTVPKIRDDLNRVGVKGLVEYARTLGIAVPIPAFFVVESDWWDGDQRTFPTYWDHLREMWPAPLPFALYPAENIPDWSVIR